MNTGKVKEMIHDCEHEPHVMVGGKLLTICADCRRQNIMRYHESDRAAEITRARVRRSPVYKTLDLREPTKDDLR